MYPRLKAIRRERNVSVNEMLEILGLKTKAAYYKKEQGSVKFTLEEGKLISDYLKIPIEGIFFDNELSHQENIVEQVAL